jgi:hypothetical protein
LRRPRPTLGCSARRRYLWDERHNRVYGYVSLQRSQESNQHHSKNNKLTESYITLHPFARHQKNTYLGPMCAYGGKTKNTDTSFIRTEFCGLNCRKVGNNCSC